MPRASLLWGDFCTWRPMERSPSTKNGSVARYQIPAHSGGRNPSAMCMA